MTSKKLGRVAMACALSIIVSTGTSFSSDPVNSHSAKSAAHDVTITRDSFGTPHIYAKNDYDLFYGYGYVLAEDRLYQLEMLKRSTQGKVAAVLGKDYIAFDKKQRTFAFRISKVTKYSGEDPNEIGIGTGKEITMSVRGGAVISVASLFHDATTSH